MRISDLLIDSCFLRDFNAKDKWEFFEKIANCLGKELNIPPEAIKKALEEREKLGSTAIGGGVAIPHSRVSGLEKIAIALAIKEDGLNFDAPDKLPVKLIFVVLAPENESNLYLKTLAQLARILKQEKIKENLLKAQSPEEVKRILSEVDYGY
ncbi:PTS sugar transporter subunit IIA [Thermodesulfatator atlanticus]|uniref:PTS sugar transporter subunit IIA n=1 Tax=Thermodesulfatator atlanticus TaxID=501497 RepID=UPI0003F87816|nr:PTS sugar transporter subunit IIA [Thermodesulfatator atlanticus]